MTTNDVCFSLLPGWRGICTWQIHNKLCTGVPTYLGFWSRLLVLSSACLICHSQLIHFFWRHAMCHRLWGRCVVLKPRLSSMYHTRDYFHLHFHFHFHFHYLVLPCGEGREINEVKPNMQTFLPLLGLLSFGLYVRQEKHFHLSVKTCTLT